MSLNRKSILSSFMKKLFTVVFALLLLVTSSQVVFANNGNKSRDAKNRGAAVSAQVRMNDRCDSPYRYYLASHFWRNWYKKYRNCPEDVVAPQISNIAVSSISANSVKISWVTSEKATTEVKYGTSTDYSSSSWSRSLGTSHGVTLKNLQPNTTYHYQIIARDFWGNRTVSTDASFSTRGADTVAPVISDIEVMNITDHNAKISFTTNEAARGTILFGTTSSYGLEAPGEGVKTTHEIYLRNLAPNTTYHFTVDARDESGNRAVSSDRTFITKTEETLTIAAISVSNIDRDSAVISFETTIPARAEILYGTTTAYGQRVVQNGLATSHRVTVSNLSASTAYYFQVKATAASGQSVNSGISMFSTTPKDVRSPIISRLAVTSIGRNDVTISFHTDEKALGTIYFGKGSVSIASSLAISESVFAEDHRLAMPSLEPDTEYFFIVSAKDALGNLSLSVQQSFRTAR